MAGNLTLFLITLTIFLLAFGIFCRIRNRQIIVAQDIRGLFYNEAVKLSKEERLTNNLLLNLEMMAYRINDPAVLRAAFYTNFLAKKTGRDSAVQAIDAELKLIPDELAVKYKKLMCVFVIAITFNNFFIGFLFRRFALSNLYRLRSEKDAKGKSHVRKVDAKAEVIEFTPRLKNSYEGGDLQAA